MSVGRNELCPCGSGKKHKKCCGMVTSFSQMRERKLRTAYDQINERLNTYVYQHFSREEMEQAWQQFAAAIGLSQEEAQHPQWRIHFYNWFVFDNLRDGTRVVDSFFQMVGRRVEADVQQAYRQLRLLPYEIMAHDGEQLTVQPLSGGEPLTVLGHNVIKTKPGQLLLGRLLPLGMRYLLYTGSLVLPAALKEQFAKQAVMGANTADRGTIHMYRFLLQLGGKGSMEPQHTQDKLIRAVWRPANLPSIREALHTSPYFELKQRSGAQEIWIYAARKEGGLLPALNHALLELFEVQAELLIAEETVTFEGFPDALQSLSEKLPLPAAERKEVIERLTSTGSRLTRGTIFITSQPQLPSKVMQWAVQTYFAEKWLITPHPGIEGLPPLLAAASGDRLREKLEQLVRNMEQARERGAGPGRFMRMDLLRPRLSLPNRSLSIENLLKRPLIEGVTAGSFTVQPERLADIAAFVEEMTAGRSESTVKKYDEAMNMFRSFVRTAFGRDFSWTQLRREEIAYFLVHDVLRRTEAATKTLASNLLSVLSSFIKWLDKQHQTSLSEQLLPLLSALKDDLPEAYRLRAYLQKQAAVHLHDSAVRPVQLREEAMLLLSSDESGWVAQQSDGERIHLAVGPLEEQAAVSGWIAFALIGQTADGSWRLYGTPELYPPPVANMLGVRQNALV